MPLSALVTSSLARSYRKADKHCAALLGAAWQLQQSFTLASHSGGVPLASGKLAGRGRVAKSFCIAAMSRVWLLLCVLALAARASQAQVPAIVWPFTGQGTWPPELGRAVITIGAREAKARRNTSERLVPKI